MPRVRSNGIELEYLTAGDPTDPAIVLINGFTSQLIEWHDEFCELLTAQELFVIRFDNRDCGLSTHLHGEPDITALLEGDLSTMAYRLEDMAEDVIGLLDALDIAAAHLAGVSMGGMIAQLVAIHHPDRTLSLCSIMSGTGDLAQLAPDPEASAALLQPTPTSREQASSQAVSSARVSISPRYLDEQRIADEAMAKFDRNHDPGGDMRQVAAIAIAADRSPQLAQLRLPTLVIHGDFDPMIVLSAGEATADAVPEAELLVIEDMGHYLSEEFWPEITRAIAANARRAAAAR